MKKKRWIILIIVLAVVVLSVPAALFCLGVFNGDNNDEYVYYSATEVSSDGDELTDKGVKKQLGVDDVSYIMSLVLKDTGDCGIYMLDQGFLGTWEEADNTITVKALPKKLELQKKWGNLEYATEFNGNDIVVKLERVDSTPECFAKHPEYTFGLKYNSKDTAALNNFMLDGNYYISNGKLYGKFFNKDGKSILGSCELSGGNKPEIGNVSALAPGGNAKFITENNGYLYYLWAADGKESICRVSMDGGDPEVLREGECDYVQVRYGKVYFTNENFRLCSMKLDGKKEHVVIDKAVFVPYVVDKNWIVYQDDADGEHLHIGTLDGKYDVSFTGERSYTWTVIDRDMYYASTTDEKDAVKHKCQLHKLNTVDFKNLADENAVGTEISDGFMGDVFAVNKDSVFGGDGESVALKDWKTINNTLYEMSNQPVHLLYLSNKYKITGATDGAGNFITVNLTNLKSGKDCSIIK